MTHFIESAFADASLHIRHEIDPEGNLRTIKRGLLDQTLGAIGNISKNDIISLISRIAEEITLEDGLRTW